MHCTNTVGSYICGCWNGYETVIISDWVALKRVPTCVDIDECSNQESCPDKSDCQNTAGNYTCACHTGFQGSACTDIDECTLTSSCHSNATCKNSEGSFKCSCNLGFHGDGQVCKEGHCNDRRCPYGRRCVSLTSNECVCKEGFTVDRDTNFCLDIDECSLDHDCDRNSTCTNSEGSYTCNCDTGFFGNGKSCQAGDCTEDTCSLNEECVSERSIDCRCKLGFKRNQEGICVDIDECSTSDAKCDENADCSNTQGSYSCNCRQGFFGTGFRCFVGSCSQSNCPARQKCISPTSTDCECEEGFVQNQSVCADIDECTTGSYKCDESEECFNTIGSYTCDYNECNTNIHDCNNDGHCTNTIGSFTCPCNTGNGECRSKWILVLSAHTSTFNSLIMDGKGQSKEIGFNFGKAGSKNGRTEVKGSCSIVWKGEMYVFGGSHVKRQISIVDKCQLKSVGLTHRLQFDMVHGACAQRDNVEIFICFADIYNSQTTKNCHRATDPLEFSGSKSFLKLPSSTYHHGYTSIAVTSGKLDRERQIRQQ